MLLSYSSFMLDWLNLVLWFWYPSVVFELDVWMC